MATTAKLRIEFFGELRFTVKDAVENEVMHGVTARLLAYLALHSDHETSRELLCELLWEGTPESARQSLRQALHELRKHLEPAPIEKGSLLTTTRNGVRLNPLALSTDVAEFEGIIAQTTHTTSIEERAALFASALALVKDVFLLGYYDEWIVAEQTRLTSDYDYACLEYLRILEVLERTDEAVALANQILTDNPCQEEVHCTLMRVYAARGHTKLVQRQVEKLRKCLEADGMGTPRIATDAYIESLLQEARLGAPNAKAPPSAKPATPESKLMLLAPTSSATSTKWRKEWAFLLLPFALFLLWNKTSAPKHPDPKPTPPNKQVANVPFTAQPSLSATQPPPPKKIEHNSGSTPKRSDGNRVEVQPVGQVAKRGEDRPSPPKTKLPESLIPVPVPVTEERRPLWIARFVNETGDIDSRPSVVKTDGQGNIYVGGLVKNRVFDENRKHDVEQVDFIVLKYFPDGTKIWGTRFDGLDHDCDRVTDMAVDTTGNVYVTGDSENRKAHNRLIYDARDIVTLKIDSASGKILWNRRYDPSDGDQDIPAAIAVDNTGNVYVAGTSVAKLAHKGWDGTDIVVVKYDSEGNQKWEGRYNGIHRREDKANAMAVDSVGNVYLTGSSRDNITGLNWVTMKFDTNNPDGIPKWIELYDGTEHGDDEPVALALGKSGCIYVTGYAQMHGSRKDYVTMKCGNNGGVKWNRSYNGTSGDEDKPKALALDAEENVYVTGESDGLGTKKDYATVKYLSETGHEEWVHTENGSWSDNDVAEKIVVGKHGRVYVTGTVHGGNGDKNGTESDIFTTSYRTDKKAKPVWESVYNGPILRGSDAGFAITSDNDGNIIVVGQSHTGKSHDIVVLKYAP